MSWFKQELQAEPCTDHQQKQYSHKPVPLSPFAQTNESTSQCQEGQQECRDTQYTAYRPDTQRHHIAATLTAAHIISENWSPCEDHVCGDEEHQGENRVPGRRHI